MSLRTLTRRNDQPEDFWTISGRVTSAATGDPVDRFQVWTGDERFLGVIRWGQRPIKGVDGIYTARVDMRFSLPMMKVVAPGFLPTLLALPQEDRSHFDVALQPGLGRSGRVLLPDGRPAASVTVAWLHSGHLRILNTGVLQSRNNLIAMTDAAGRFDLAPELKMEWIVASAPEGFLMVSIEEFSKSADLVLQPWGRVTGVLKRPAGPAAGEELHLFPSLPKPNPGWGLFVADDVTTDVEGRFDYSRVPPGKYQLFYRVAMDDKRSLMVAAAPPFTLSPGQTLEMPIEAEARKTAEDLLIRRLEPAIKSGPPLRGVVLLADGQPAANADVGLIVPNECLQLLRCALKPARPSGLGTLTDASGHFELPGVQGVRAVVAVHRSGFAKVSPAQDGQTLTLTLQPWGRISGMLRIGNRLGANERVYLAPLGSFNEQRMLFYTLAYEARTDSQGQFVLTYVPPGEHTLVRQIQAGENSWQSGIPTIIDVKAGETTVVTLGGTGWQVIGKIIRKAGASPMDWTGVKISLFTFQYGPPKELKTQGERQAWDESPEGRIAVNKRRHYEGSIADDGSFAFEEVDAEEYILSVRRTRRFQKDGGMEFHEMMLGSKNVTIPAATTGDNATPYDLGFVEANLSLLFSDRVQ